MRIPVILVFLSLMLIQWYFLGDMIWQKEKIVRRGTKVKFMTAPVDPSDPIRGKYIRLDFAENSFLKPADFKILRGKPVYALLKMDSKGFAHVSDITQSKPGKNQLFLKTGIRDVVGEENGKRIYFDYSFNRYYVMESHAPIAEIAYNGRSVDSSLKTYALMSVLNGEVVIRDLFINDSSLNQIIDIRK